MSDPCIIVGECDMVDLGAFLPELQLAFPSMPDEILANYVRTKAITFCERSSLVKQMLPVDLQCGVPNAIIEASCGMNIVSLERLSRGHDYHHGHHLRRHSQMTSWSTCGTSSVWFVPPFTLEFSPAPVQDRREALWVLASVAPDRDACEVPRVLYQRFANDIINGVKAEMYLLKGQDWYDANLSKRFDDNFKAAITGANIERLMGNTRGPVNMRPRNRFV